MAVTLTVPELAAAVRVDSTSLETAEMTRLLAYGTEAVTKFAPGAPDAVHNEALIRLAGYLFDQPHAPRRPTNALRRSGALVMLAPYRVHRAGLV